MQCTHVKFKLLVSSMVELVFDGELSPIKCLPSLTQPTVSHSQRWVCVVQPRTPSKETNKRLFFLVYSDTTQPLLNFFFLSPFRQIRLDFRLTSRLAPVLKGGFVLSPGCETRVARGPRHQNATFLAVAWSDNNPWNSSKPGMGYTQYASRAIYGVLWFYYRGALLGCKPGRVRL